MSSRLTSLIQDAEAVCGKDSNTDELVFVRERGFARFAAETKALSKVVGVVDMTAWNCGKYTFDEISPMTVKKLVAGNARASKEQVSEALTRFVGDQTYTCDDESDAVAVGIAWLIQKNFDVCPVI